MTDPTTPSHEAHTSGSHFQPSLSVVLVIVVLFIAATFLMVRAVSPSTAATGTATTTTTSGSTTPTSGTIVKSRVRVQVANGTEITGLAAHFTQILMTQDWDTLPPGNGPHVSSTTIYFNTGYQSAAIEIASTIKVARSAVHPLHHLSPVAGASGDDVIVILGPNSGIK
jgi:hypothetical protein